MRVWPWIAAGVLLMPAGCAVFMFYSPQGSSILGQVTAEVDAIWPWPRVTAGATASDLMREAVQAAEADEPLRAEQLLMQVLERTDDPGQVAYNLGVVESRRGNHREAERWFIRTLADRDCPPQRAARAWYNRGVCLLLREPSVEACRTAIVCFRNCLDLVTDDAGLRTDAEHNLELAKQRWEQLRRQQRQPPRPDDPLPQEPTVSPPPESTPRAEPTPHQQPGNPPPAGGTMAKHPATPGGTVPPPGARPVAGAGTVEALRDTSTVQPLTPEDTRWHLQQIARRLREDRQQLRQTLYGPERLDIPDW